MSSKYVCQDCGHDFGPRGAHPYKYHKEHPQACLRNQARVQQTIDRIKDQIPLEARIRVEKDPTLQYVGLNLKDPNYFCQLAEKNGRKFQLPVQLSLIDPVYSSKTGMDGKKVNELLKNESSDILKYLYQIYRSVLQLDSWDLSYGQPILQLVKVDKKDLKLFESKSYDIYRYVNEKGEVVENDPTVDVVRIIYDQLVRCLFASLRRASLDVWSMREDLTWARQHRSAIDYQLRDWLRDDNYYRMMDKFRQLIDKYYGDNYFDDELLIPSIESADYDEKALRKTIGNHYWRSYEKDCDLPEGIVHDDKKDLDESLTQIRLIGSNLFLMNCWANKNHYQSFKQAFIQEILEPSDALPPNVPPMPADLFEVVDLPAPKPMPAPLPPWPSLENLLEPTKMFGVDLSVPNISMERVEDEVETMTMNDLV